MKTIQQTKYTRESYHERKLREAEQNTIALVCAAVLVLLIVGIAASLDTGKMPCANVDAQTCFNAIK